MGKQRPPPQRQTNLQLVTRQSVHYRLPLDVLEQLDAYAAAENRDRTAIVLDGLLAYFRAHPVKMGKR